MTAQPFLVRAASIDGHRIVQTPRVSVQWGERRRAKRTRYVPGLGPISEVERVGWDRSKLQVRAVAVFTGDDVRDVAVPVVGADGRRDGRGGQGNTVAATAAGVKSVVRRIRPQEAEELDAVDAEIAAHEEALRELRGVRRQVVSNAWTKGHVVRLQDVTPDGDERRYLEPEGPNDLLDDL